MVYRWVLPYAWLESKASEWPAEQLYQELLSLAAQLSSDLLQDIYQAEMEANGYFEEEKGN